MTSPTSTPPHRDIGSVNHPLTPHQQEHRTMNANTLNRPLVRGAPRCSARSHDSEKP